MGKFTQLSYDIFMSYATVDKTRLKNDYLITFRDEVLDYLTTTSEIGDRKPVGEKVSPSVVYIEKDEKSLVTHNGGEQYWQQATNSDSFIVFLSNAYLNSEACLTELSEFLEIVKGGGTRKALARLHVLPLGDPSSLMGALRDSSKKITSCTESSSEALQGLRIKISDCFDSLLGEKASLNYTSAPFDGTCREVGIDVGEFKNGSSPMLTSLKARDFGQLHANNFFRSLRESYKVLASAEKEKNLRTESKTLPASMKPRTKYTNKPLVSFLIEDHPVSKDTESLVRQRPMIQEKIEARFSNLFPDREADFLPYTSDVIDRFSKGEPDELLQDECFGGVVLIRRANIALGRSLLDYQRKLSPKFKRSAQGATQFIWVLVTNGPAQEIESRGVIVVSTSGLETTAPNEIVPSLKFDQFVDQAAKVLGAH
jgi:hypothetical protein